MKRNQPKRSGRVRAFGIFNNTVVRAGDRRSPLQRASCP